MPILNIAGYKFLTLTDLPLWRENLMQLCAANELRGTILLSPEGININLAGNSDAVQNFMLHLKNHPEFKNINFHKTYSETIPFKRLKVKIKKEIITFGQTSIDPISAPAPSLSPEEFKQWLDENRDITVLDTRNHYEIALGKFKGAVNLNLNDFISFPTVIEKIDKNKPVVMYCTGGIRCEKAALYMLDQGYQNVYQLNGGILGYFAVAGGRHYEGTCFVFDERVALRPDLQSAK